LNATELIEIIYALQQNERILREEKEKLQSLLDDKTIRLERSGSIAEAALDLNHIFEDAEAAAQQYLDSLTKTDERASRILADAEEKAAEIIAAAEGKAADVTADAERHAKETEDECRTMRDKAAHDIQQQIDAFTRSVKQMLEKHPQLDAYMRKESGL